MNPLRIPRTLLAAAGVLVALVVSLVLALGGGGSSQSTYTVTINGHTVTQAHSPALAAPKPGTQLPAAIAPVPAPPKVRAVAHAKHAAPVSHVAKVIPAHRAARAPPRAAGDVSIATVEQFDSVTIGTVPSWAHYVAGYVDGAWRTYFSLKARGFPVVVGISVNTNHGADCFDMEPGNPGPENAAPWASWQFTQGNDRPCEYSMLSWMGAIKQNLANHGVQVCSAVIIRHCVRLWDANWTYVRHLDSGYACTQWTDRAFGLNLDESTCLLSFYGPPAPPPDPYRIYLKTRFLLQFGLLASEYNTVKAWDSLGCENPVRRAQCHYTLFHLRLLRDRAIFVAHHQVVGGRWRPLRKPRYAYANLGGRIHGLEARITAPVGHRCSPKVCG